MPKNSALAANPPLGGNSVLEVSVKAGEHSGISLEFDFTDQGLAEPEEVYFRYYAFFPDNWRRNGGEVGKLPGFGGTYGNAGWGGRRSHGHDGWSARMMNHDRGDKVKVGFYAYYADMAGTYGTHLGWENDSLGYLARNRWHALEVYTRMNSVTGPTGNHDGILRGWVNGKLAFEKTDLRFRDLERLKVEMIWFNIYVGGSWTAPHDMKVFFDNVVIAKKYIGPMPPALSVISGKNRNPFFPPLKVVRDPRAVTLMLSSANPEVIESLRVFDLAGKTLWQSDGRGKSRSWLIPVHLPYGLYLITPVSRKN